MHDKMHWLIVVSGNRIPKTVRMMFDQTIVIPENHRCYSMVSNDGRVVVAFSERLNGDVDKILLQYLADKCPTTIHLKLRSPKLI